MSLYFKRLIALEGVHYDLDTTRLVRFADTCEEGSTIVHHLELVQVDGLFKAADFLFVLDLTDRFVLTCGEDRE